MLIRCQRGRELKSTLTPLFSIGRVDGQVLFVVYTWRTTREGRPVRRIISARLANRKERNAYRAIYG